MRRPWLYVVPSVVSVGAVAGALLWFQQHPTASAAPAPAPSAAVDSSAPCALTAPSAAATAQRVDAWAAGIPAASPPLLSASEVGDYNLATTGTAGTPRELSRRAVLDAAFAALSTPCADPRCASLVPGALEAAAGLATSPGARVTGSFSMSVATLPAAHDRLRLLDDLQTHYLVLLEAGGRDWLYLGRDASGVPHALGGVAEPKGCTKSARPTVFPLEGVLASVARVKVLGGAPTLDLLGEAVLRPPAPVTPPEGDACQATEGAAMFVTPKVPNATQPLRVMVTLREHPGPAALSLVAPSGETLKPELVRFGGPPFTYVATVPSPTAGEWRAAFGDGARVVSCHTFAVKEAPPKSKKAELSDPVWTNERAWGTDTENLYAAFVESLFSYPLDQDLTWSDLHTLLRDQERNLLYNHLSRNEDETLNLEPDCADLPVALRAYFAWKMRLPYGNRECDRGKAGQPPECEALVTNNMSKRAELGQVLLNRIKPKEPAPGASTPAPVPAPEASAGPTSAPVKKTVKGLSKAVDDVVAFQFFVRDAMAATNSGSGRVAPRDSATDYYPVPLTREALRPGTVFADPYGHIMILVQWVPQKFDKYGILMGADAQPDSTVGRRRFWRGAFLFVSSTKDVGAGFKAHRPVVASGKKLSSVSNKRLTGENGFVAFSEQQYAGSTDDFYDQMDALANPRPLDALAMQRSLLDSLAEAVSRRVTAIQNGEDFMKETKYAVIEMPQGYSIFETSGPWEDFATPSRDMRLLISIDTVERFADAVKRNPARFGIEGQAALDATLKALADELARELSARTFQYNRTDGTPWTLSLQDVLDRKTAYEVGYNPNDCAEARWGAPEGSEEAKTCNRRAPSKQAKLLATYRDWFAKRQRPPRG